MMSRTTHLRLKNFTTPLDFLTLKYVVRDIITSPNLILRYALDYYYVIEYIYDLNGYQSHKRIAIFYQIVI